MLRFILPKSRYQALLYGTIGHTAKTVRNKHTHLCQLEHGEFARVANVERANLVAFHDHDDALDKVRDVLERASLLAIAIHGQRLVCQSLGYEELGCVCGFVGMLIATSRPRSSSHSTFRPVVCTSPHQGDYADGWSGFEQAVACSRQLLPNADKSNVSVRLVHWLVNAASSK